MSELCFKSATELRQMIHVGEISATEVLEAHIDRIERFDGTLNAVVTRAFDLARASARTLDQRLAKGEAVGPLAGLPIAHKDLVDTKGIRTTSGSPMFSDHVPDTDALIVRRMKAADAVTIGKTNTPEFGAGSQTFNRVFGATRNPWDTSRTCGGSSGGAAVALAARFVPIADGSDTGGSLRNPAAFCNVVGFRPSPGRVPVIGWSDLSTAGPMARSVDDAALLFSVLAGPDLKSPTAQETAGTTFSPVRSVDLSGLRIAVSEDFGALPVASEIRAGVARLAALLKDTGATVIEAAPDFRDATRIFHILRAIGFRARYGSMTAEQQAQLKDTIIWNMEAGQALTNDDYDWLADARRELIGRVADFFSDHDLLIGPTTQVLPFSVDTEWVQEVEGKPMSTYIEWMESCSWISTICCPSLSLPIGFSAPGDTPALPIGAQLIAPMRQDAFLLGAAKAIEAIASTASEVPEITAG